MLCDYDDDTLIQLAPDVLQTIERIAANRPLYREFTDPPTIIATHDDAEVVLASAGVQQRMRVPYRVPAAYQGQIFIFPSIIYYYKDGIESVREILWHEFTHAADRRTSLPEYQYTGINPDYLNNPTEVEANAVAVAESIRYAVRKSPSIRGEVLKAVEQKDYWTLSQWANQLLVSMLRQGPMDPKARKLLERKVVRALQGTI